MTKLCECGQCGREVKEGKRFISGHNGRCRSQDSKQNQKNTWNRKRVEGYISPIIGRTKETYEPLMQTSIKLKNGYKNGKLKPNKSTFKKGHIPHNKNKNKENYEPSKNSSLKQIGKPRLYLLGEANTIKRLNRNEKARKSLINMWANRTDEEKRKIGEKIRQSNLGHPPTIGAGIGKCGFREDIGHYVRSRWEANFARFLKFMNIEYEYEPQTFILSTKQGYTPDFQIKNSNLFIEIKGYMNDKSKTQIELFRREYPQYELAILGVNEYPNFKKCFNIFRIQGWEE